VSKASDAITTRWSEIEPLLDRLLDLPPDERAAALERECSDADLAAAVHGLLAVDIDTDSGIDRLAREIGTSPAGIEGRQVGPYRIERALGEGGMGAVFLAARQTAEFTQHVALKLLRIGLFSAEQQELFRREQQIHARLEHPNIARIYDSGITDAGVPYFAMEYVDGVSLMDYCDRERLGIDARLRLFAAVCDAVAFAHRNLVVHRDLKPSNILVDAAGAPKLLDFGIAKLLSGADAPNEQTRTGLRRLTPDYAAPEQFDGGAITTATDVYALGVLLCELLSGARPIDSGIDASPLRTASRIVDADTAQRRGLGVAALKRRLRGDLEAIVAKTLQRDPAHRYSGAAALRDDIERHRNGQPIRARPAAAAYRLRKFIQRHTLGFAASLLLAVTLVGATAFSFRQAGIAGREAARATAEADRANAVRMFLQELFDSAAPGVSTAESADELLLRGRERVDRDFAANPDLHTEILGLLGDLQRRRGHAEQAREPLEQAAALARRQFGAGDARTLHAEYLLALQAEDAGQYRDGAARLQHALDDFEAQRRDDPAHQGTETEVQALTELGLLDQRAGDNSQAVALARRALDMARRVLPPDHPTAIRALGDLGDVLMEAGHYADAVPLLSEVLERERRRLGTQHADVAVALAALASANHKLGRYAQAEQLLRDAVAIDAKAYSQPNHRAASHLNNLGVELIAEGKLDEGIENVQKSIALDRQIYPAGHPETADSYVNVAMVRLRQGRYAEAETAMRAGMAEEVRARGADYPDIGYDQNSLARILIAEGKLDEAQPLLDAALADSRKRHGEQHVYAASALISQSMLYAARNDHLRASVLAREAVEMYEQLLPANHNKTTAARLVLGENLHALERYADARAIFAQAVAYARGTSSAVPVLLAHALADLARADDALGQTGEAADLRREAENQLAQVPEGPNAERDEVTRLLTSPAAAPLRTGDEKSSQ
jgi:serine/threonine-protein kinase